MTRNRSGKEKHDLLFSLPEGYLEFLRVRGRLSFFLRVKYTRNSIIRGQDNDNDFLPSHSPLSQRGPQSWEDIGDKRDKNKSRAKPKSQTSTAVFLKSKLSSDQLNILSGNSELNLFPFIGKKRLTLYVEQV